MSTTPDTSDAIAELAAACKVLGEPRRLRILRFLLEAPDTLCGCELSDILGVPDYQISRDLSALRGAGLVRDRGRSGTWVHYEPVPDAPQHLGRLLALVRETPLAADDARRFELRYGLRAQVGCVLGPGHPDVTAAFVAAGVEPPKA